LDATSPDRFKDCLVQQQFTFDGQLRFAAEQPVHFAHQDIKFKRNCDSLSICGDYFPKDYQFALSGPWQVFAVATWHLSGRKIGMIENIFLYKKMAEKIRFIRREIRPTKRCNYLMKKKQDSERERERNRES